MAQSEFAARGIDATASRLPAGSETEQTDAGLLVYEPDDAGLGRQLSGFADVDDWDAMRHELIARGHGTGALYHLPTYR